MRPAEGHLHGIEAHEEPVHRPVRPPMRKLPVIGRHGTPDIEARRALEQVSDDLSPAELEELFAEFPMPTSREECRHGIRPCPFAGCRHHLFLEVHPTSGSIRLNHPGVDIEDMKETCSLDVGAAGSAPLSEVAEHLGISHERVRQIEDAAKMNYALADAQRRERGARTAGGRWVWR